MSLCKEFMKKNVMLSTLQQVTFSNKHITYSHNTFLLVWNRVLFMLSSVRNNIMYKEYS